VKQGIAPGGTHANRRFLSDWVTYAEDITVEEQLILCDAQTSGGLLAAVPAAGARDLVLELRKVGAMSAAIIGRLKQDNPGKISVVRNTDCVLPAD
jgi:selenide,water dikinase